MKTHIFSYLFAFFAFFFLLSTPVAAQNPIEFQGLRFACLELTLCRTKGLCSTENVHRAKLTTRADVKGIPNDPNTYITECFEYEKDDELTTTCTTGSSTLDKELFCNDPNATDPQCDHKSILEDDIDGYSLEEGKYGDYGVFFTENGNLVEKNPPTKISTDANGNIVPSVIEWQSFTEKEHVRKFLIWNKTSQREDQQTPSSSGLGGQQQADLNFLFRSSTCVGEQWDPYGKVFDIDTLQPMTLAQVALKQFNGASSQYEQVYASAMNPNINNPFFTGFLGKFNFIVVDGDYTLTPSFPGYTHPNSAIANSLSTEARAQMNLVYSNIYYSDSDPIRQRGVIQQRDVPLKLAPGAKAASTPISILSESTQVQSNGQVIYSGIVSHPLAQLKVEVCESNATCGQPVIYTAQQGGPDKNGVFRVVLDQTKLVAGQSFKKTFSTINLTTPSAKAPSWFAKALSFMGSLIAVEAQEQSGSVSSTIQPIPTYVEGYAYDTDGNILPNAVVGIYVNFSNNPIYQTRANAQGYFKITSDKLPTTSYSIGYSTAPNQKAKSKVTTSQFLLQNQEFTAAEKVDPYMFATASTDPRRNITPSYSPQAKIAAVSNQFKETEPVVNTPPTQPEVAQKGSNNILLIGAILLLLVATVGTLIGVYLYKKKMQDSQT